MVKLRFGQPIPSDNTDYRVRVCFGDRWPLFYVRLGEL